jgi:hypothetical protein
MPPVGDPQLRPLHQAGEVGVLNPRKCQTSHAI